MPFENRKLVLTMSRYDDDNDVVVGDDPGEIILINLFTETLFFLLLDLPAASFTDNTTANITEYPINYADLASPLDGVPELRMLK